MIPADEALGSSDPAPEAPADQSSSVSELREQLERRTALLELLQDIAVIANQAITIDEALYAAMRRICEFNGWAAAHAYRLIDERSEVLMATGTWYAEPGVDVEKLRRASAGIRFRIGEGLVGRVAEAGEPIWVTDVEDDPRWQRMGRRLFGFHACVMFPLLVGERVIGVMEFYSPSHIRLEPDFRELIYNAGIQLGHVIQRKWMEKHIVEVAESEHQRIGAELHDTIGQRCYGLEMLTRALHRQLDAQGSPLAEEVEPLLTSLGEVKGEVEEIIRGLVPLEIEDVADALTAVAERARALYDIECELVQETPTPPTDRSTTIQLYRIAQEAIHNAVRHGGAARVTLELAADPHNDHAWLRIHDDGRGFDLDQPHNAGMGLQIMRQRAGLIGGHLELRRNPQGGITVECTFPQAR